MSYILIVGATSSIARALVRVLASSGKDVVLCAKDMQENERIAADARIRCGIRAVAYQLDVSHLADHDDFFLNIAKKHGKAEGVILFQGAMSAEDGIKIPSEDVQRMVTVNFSSVVTICNACLGIVAKGGYLAVVTSVAGERGKRRNLVYNATKAAASTYLEGLRQSTDIAIIDIRPGFVDTPLTFGSVTSVLMATRERVANDILKGIRKRRAVVYTPWFWRWIMLIIRCMPRWFFDRLRL